jgi:hypothetical protein
MNSLHHNDQELGSPPSFSSAAFHFCSLVILILLLRSSEYSDATERAFAQSGKNFTFLMVLDENSDIVSQPEEIDTDADGNIYLNDIDDNQIQGWPFNIHVGINR